MPCAPASNASCRISFSSGVPCTENDYKLWSPSDERGNECLLGHKTVFKRRTPHATCFNGEDFDRPVVVSNCSCTREDYEWLVDQLHQCLGIELCFIHSAVWETDEAMALSPEERKGITGNKSLLSIFYVPGTVLSTFCIGYSISFLRLCSAVELLQPRDAAVILFRNRSLWDLFL